MEYSDADLIEKAKRMMEQRRIAVKKWRDKVKEQNPEKYEEIKAKNRERTREYRARKKAEQDAKNK